LSNLDANLREEMRFEIRRLHDATRTTTVYVTHDQAEAMTTADQIAVMNAGKIEQLGTPEEIYERPVSEFVARFIGAANVLAGTAADAEHVTVAGRPVRTSGMALTPGAKARFSIRQHEIEMLASAPAGTEANVLQAQVRRQVFLGNVRDYLVGLTDGTEVRITAPPSQSMAEGAGVWLRLPVERCRALAR
jgi:iron(III) transport system ATP-binding protein